MNPIIESIYKVYLEHPKVITDSRSITPGAIFFAIKGDTFNGNDFAIDAIRKGAALAVIDQDILDADKRFLRVDNVLQILQQLANHHRQKLGLKIVGITGSNGKTTTKELIQRVLSKKFATKATEGNLNNHIGVPLTLLSLTSNLDFAIVEMGANHLGEIAALCEIARPDYGIITNVGKAHLEGFGSFEGVIKAKSELYEFLKKSNGMVFIHSENEHLIKAAKGIPSFSYGSSEDADCPGKITGNNPFLSVECRLNQKSLTIDSRLTGKYNFENILAAVCIGTYFNIPPTDIKEAIESYEPSNNRSQIFTTSKNTLILDAYNANPSSMKAAIENFADTNFQNKILILGDMLELGDETEKEHEAILELCHQLGFKYLLLVGPVFNRMTKKTNYNSFATSDQLAEFLRNNPVKNSTILLKGSRKIQLEKVVSLL